MMEKLWCWRCRQVVGMLNEEEYRIAHELYGRGFKNNSGVYADRFRELLNYYFEITGEVITEPNAVMHHRIAQYIMILLCLPLGRLTNRMWKMT